ncbi:hypothetical protein Vi05172_g2995 [Venturia inaequalis]|nr:hypothetical protein Vi05172_g2995 [Venturia inaequalis]
MIDPRNNEAPAESWRRMVQSGVFEVIELDATSQFAPTEQPRMSFSAHLE